MSFYLLDLLLITLSHIFLPKCAGLISRLDSGGNAQLLGLHNLAMALLVLHHKGQAEQKVLVNFWRKLRGACLQVRHGTPSSSQFVCIT